MDGCVHSHSHSYSHPYSTFALYLTNNFSTFIFFSFPKVNIMYTGLDAVGVDQQPIVNFNEWRLLYFIAFILLVGFFVLNMFVGVVVENFHRCREEQEKEEKVRRAAKRAVQMEKKRKRK